jgi:small acid-soluble spore protein H (minor)
LPWKNKKKGRRNRSLRYERVEQIVKSPETIEVLYKGRPVWINSLNPGRETADVLMYNESITVPVSELTED